MFDEDDPSNAAGIPVTPPKGAVYLKHLGSRRNRLQHITVSSRRGHAEWVQTKPRPPKFLDCRQAQRHGRRKK